MQADRGVGAWRREDGSEEARADATPKGTCVCLSLLLALTSPPKAHPTQQDTCNAGSRRGRGGREGVSLACAAGVAAAWPRVAL